MNQPVPLQPFERRDYTWIAVLLLGASLLYVWGLGSFPLWDPWEPKYAQAMHEMMERDDLVTPYLNRKIRWTKPILTYWAMYLPIRIAGNNEWTTRLPSALAAMGGVAALYYFLRRLRSRPTAIVGAAVLATLPQYFYMARQAMPDMLLTLFMGAAMGFLALGRFADREQGRHLALFYACMGLAFLTKGPVAGAVTLCALLIFWSIDIDALRPFSLRRLFCALRSMLSRYRVGWGFLIFAAIAAPWTIAILIKHGSLFVDRFIFSENLHRFNAPLRDHHGTAVFYLRQLFHGMYPWSGLLPVAALFMFHGRRTLDESTRQIWYYLSWCLAVYVIMTAAGTKLDHYALPALPAVAVLVALVWERYLARDAPFWIRPALLGSILFLLLPIRDFLLEGHKYAINVFAHRGAFEHEPMDLALKIVFAAWTAAILLAIFRRRSVLAVCLVVLVAFGHAAYMSHVVMPAQTPLRTMKYYLETFQERSTAEGELVLIGDRQHSLVYYDDGIDFLQMNHGEQEVAVIYAGARPDAFFVIDSSVASTFVERLREAADPRYSIVRDDHGYFSLIGKR